MKIQIDTELLANEGITLDEYFILKCLYDENLNEIFNVFSNSNDLIKGLERNGFVKTDISNWMVRSRVKL